MSERALPRSTTLLAGALLAVLVTIAILLFDWTGTKASEQFVRQTGFVLWAVLLCVQSALWAVLAPSLWTSLRRLHADYPVARAVELRIAVSVVVILALAAGFSVLFTKLHHPDPPLTHYVAKLSLIVAAGFFVMALAGIGIWLVEVACQRLSAPGPEERLGDYLRLRADLRRFLNAAALIIGTVTLSVGAERGAMLGFEPIDYPSQHVLYYGIYFSLLLALMYIPAYVAFRGVGNVLLDALLPPPGERSTAWADWYANRRALEALLEIDVVTSKGLQTTLAIGAPFVGSAIGLLIGGT